jgi:hypothetical protein
MQQEGKYKMNRTKLAASTFEEADDHVSYWKNKTPLERLEAACFIINNIFNVTAASKIKKDIVTSRKHSDG